jgi:hypothetical protein
MDSGFLKQSRGYAQGNCSLAASKSDEDGSSLRARSPKTFKFPNENALSSIILCFVARCVPYRHKLRNEAQTRSLTVAALLQVGTARMASSAATAVTARKARGTASDRTSDDTRCGRWQRHLPCALSLPGAEFEMRLQFVICFYIFSQGD